jgi:putative membrane protein
MASLARSLTTDLAWSAIRAFCRRAVRRVDLRIEGAHHLPATGPALIAARHFHHFYDGCALLAIVPRPLHLVVALDWVEHPAGRSVMEQACAAAGWPIVVRPDHPRRRGGLAGAAGGAADVSALRDASREIVRRLRDGQMVLVFPEGYPNVDPGYTPKTGDDAFLPFRPGFLRFVEMAERDGPLHVPIVPAGLEYRRGDRWALTVRFGEPVALDRAGSRADQVHAVEERVRCLSGLTGPRHEAGARDEIGAVEYLPGSL